MAVTGDVAARPRRSSSLAKLAEPDRLAAAIVAALADPAAAAARADRAHQRFLARFTIDRVVDQMGAFYERALAAAGRVSPAGAPRT